MFLIALILTGFAVGSLCADEPHQPRSLEEPVFGIEFSMENIMISFAPSDGHVRGLAAVKGDIAYQNLMGSYLEICSETHHTQTPPWTYHEYRAIMARGYQTRTILRPDLLDWYDWSQFQVELDIDAPQTLPELDEHSNYTDIAILANAVEGVKRAAADLLASQYNIDMPDRPLVSIAAPSFMWTVIEPEACTNESRQDCEYPSDSYPSTWHHVFTLKMSDAVQRAGFRRGVIDEINTTMQVNGYQNHTSPIAPAGHAAFWNPGFQLGANATSHYQTANSVLNHEGLSAVAVELTNMTLSMWAQQECHAYSPWSTMPQLGVESNQDLPAYMRSPEDIVWGYVVSMIRRLRSSTTRPDGEALDVYLIGDAWEDELVDAFKAYLHTREHTDLNVEFRGMFAASDGAASVAREMLDACGT